ncbi:hypothetical protein KI688_005728 [Linnemannia hyalina]|uniref:Kelch repeat protein n=1 Tax=Linnemannia hyalina TaxID=64524 RepID=A0A9P8BXR5_9FUNG|nr:hypothetical protein KI688_005728 [Linnemannia hyalina]
MIPLHAILRLAAAGTFVLWLTWTASAQSSPMMVYNMAYATVNESTLYIHGGFNGTNPNYNTRFNQFFSLNLTQSWNTSNPLWTQITAVGGTPAQLTTAGHTMSISQSRDSQGFLHDTVTVWDMVNPLTFAASYYFGTKSWQELPALPPPEPGPLRFYQAATHLKTGRVYIPGCAGTSMLGYDWSTSTSSVLPMPYLGNITSWNGYSFVWNAVRESFFLFGGVGAPSETSYLYEYKMSTTPPTWEFLQSYGSIPPHLSEMCMVSVGTLYILDVPTMTWTRGPSSQPRKGMACAVAGSNFVVWGVYNINSGQWTTQFVASHRYTENEPGQADCDRNNRHVKAGMIIGIVTGAAVAVAILIAVTRKVWKRVSRRGLQDQQGREQGHGQEQGHGKGKDLEDNAAPHISDILGDPDDVHQKEPQTRHHPQLFTTNTDSSYNAPEQAPRSPQG